jgi:D-psicose/D-tagatose/L-ribulose 3-epimerase
MKVGMNLLLWTGQVTEEHLPLLEQVKSWGAEGVELPMFNTEGSPWSAIAKQCDDLGLGRTAVAVMPEGGNLVGDEAGEREVAVTYLKKCVDVSAEAGIELICGPIYSPVGRLVGRGPSKDEHARAAEGLRAVGEHAQGSGVVLGIEPLNRFETYVFNTQAQTAAVVDAIGLDTVQQMYDTFHANIEEKCFIGALKDGGKRIKHVHISACDRGTPGEDHIPYGTVFTELKAMGYDGWLTIESFGHRIAELAGATCIWREVSPNEEHVTRKGAKFIKEAWAKA